MDLRLCDSCGAAVSPSDVFFVVRLAISKALAWTKAERLRSDRLVSTVRKEGFSNLADAIERTETATIAGDHDPRLQTQADLRVCMACVIAGKVKIDLGALIQATERRPDVSAQEAIRREP